MNNTSKEKKGEKSKATLKVTECSVHTSNEKGDSINTFKRKGDISNISQENNSFPNTIVQESSLSVSQGKGGNTITSVRKGGASNFQNLEEKFSNISKEKGEFSNTSKEKGGDPKLQKLDTNFSDISIQKGEFSSTLEKEDKISNIPVEKQQESAVSISNIPVEKQQESVVNISNIPATRQESVANISETEDNTEPQLSNMGELRVGVDAPKLNDYESYEQFREVVEMWDLTSDHPPRKRGSLLALALPNKSSVFGNSIQTSLFKKIKPATLAAAEDGVKQILEFLDALLGQDDFTKEINAFEKIWNLRKRAGQTIVEYVKDFELKINECSLNNCEFTDKCKAFMLLLAAGLTHTQYELIKGTVNLNETGKVFQNVKAKMVTMLTNSIGNVVGNSKPDNVDEAFFAEHEQAFLAWSKKKGNFKGKSWGNNNNSSSFQKQSNDPINPKDKDGRTYKCRICDSYRHLARQCPHNTKNKNPTQFSNSKGSKHMYMAEGEKESVEKGNVTEPESDEEEREKVYFTTNQKELSKFTAESLNSAALDTCCTKSLAGQKWLDIFLQSAPKHLLKDVKGPYASNTTFEFGNQAILKAGKAYTIPVIIGEDYHQIEIDIIDSDIPLLLSKEHMKKIGIALDMSNDTATVKGKKLDVNTTSAGHFTVSLFGGNDEIDDNQVMNEVMAVQLIDGDEKKKLKMLTKLHRQFAHRPKLVFVNLLKTAGQWDESFDPLIDKIINGCEGCILRKRNNDRPAVAMTMANDFNQVVSLDLKIRGDTIILYMIDIFTRYTLATTIPNKNPESVVKALIRTWIRYFGLMEGLMFDNGGEFSNEWMREVCSKLDIKNHTTGAYSPFQNGINEINHAHADGMADCVERDFPDMDIETILAWVCSAKNSLTNVYGFSPNQLVFGRNPKLPNIIDSPPPAREVKVQSKALLDMLNIMHKSREAFMRSESCEKLKKALNSKMRTAERLYRHNEWVYYRRDKDDMWMGPAKVVFQDGKVIMIRHGGRCVRVSATRLHPVHEDLAKKLDKNEENDEIETEVEKVETRASKAETKNKEDEGLRVTTEEEIFTLAREEPSENLEEVEDEREEADDEFVDAQENNPEIEDNGMTEERAEQEKRKVGRPAKKSKKKTIKPLFSPPERIEIKMDGKWEPATVLQRGAKAAGKYPTWYNFQLDNGQIFNDDANNYEYRKISEEDDTVNWAHEEVLAVLVPKEKRDTTECLEAKQKELDKLKEFGTYEVIEDEGQGHVTTTWVLTEKGTEIRARLTARGFMEDDEVPKDSPTMHKSSLRIVLAIAAAKGWTIETSDIRSAFLQGNLLDRDVYVKPPKEAGLTGKLWKLYKCLYGLRDASKQWYSKVKGILKKNGFHKSKFDSGLFYIFDENDNLIGIIGLHVDDFIHCGTEKFVKEILPKIMAEFTVGKSESGNFMYTGFMINQDATGISLDQAEYVEGIEIPTLEARRMAQTDEEMTAEELTILRKMTGQLNWTVRATRPDLSFNMIALSTKFKGGLISDLKEAKKAIANLKQNKAVVRIGAIKNLKEAEILLFTDASYGNINDGKDSTASYIIFLIDPKSGVCAPLDWRANKTKRRANSTLAAEALSLSIGLDAAVGIRWQLTEMMGEDYKLPITAIIDNKDTYDAVHSSTDVSERRLRREIAVLQEYLETEELRRILWCRGEHQLADCLTKKGCNPLPLMQVMQSGRMGDNILEIIS